MAPAPLGPTASKPIPPHARKNYTPAEVAMADAGRPDLARRMANERSRGAGSNPRVRPLAETLSPDTAAIAGLGIDPIIRRAVEYQDAHGAIAEMRRLAA